MQLLQNLKGRLHLPHQVGREFYRHREPEIAKQINAFESVKNHLNSLPTSFKGTFSRHPCIPIADIVEAISVCVAEQIKKVDESKNLHQLNFIMNDDPFLAQLDELFEGCCEGPYDQQQETQLDALIMQRIIDNEAPCYIPQTSKQPAQQQQTPQEHRHYGDARVWFQTVKHIETIKKPLVLVTADQQPNWWRTAKLGSAERPIGPHFSLIRDFEKATNTGKRFLLYSQEDFLLDASKYLSGVPEQQDAITEMKQLRDEGSGSEKDENLIHEPYEKSVSVNDEVKTSRLESIKDSDISSIKRD